jgi:hypothetical protein
LKGNRAVLTASVIVVVLLAGWWLFKRGRPVGAVHLIDRFDQAKRQPDDPALYSIVDATLNGETKKAIAIAPAVGTRLTWRLPTVPDDGWLSVYVGLKPEAWTQEGDGVLFYVGVSDGRAFEPLFTQHVHPFANSGDRKWIQVMVDLSAYAGEEVDLIFNTRSGQPEKGDIRADYALWGQPEIVQR